MNTTDRITLKLVFYPKIKNPSKFPGSFNYLCYKNISFPAELTTQEAKLIGYSPLQLIVLIPICNLDHKFMLYKKTCLKVVFSYFPAKYDF